MSLSHNQKVESVNQEIDCDQQQFDAIKLYQPGHAQK